MSREISTLVITLLLLFSFTTFQAAVVFKEDFTAASENWHLNSQASLAVKEAGGFLEVKSPEPQNIGQATYEWIPVRKSTRYKLSYSVESVQDSAKYIVMPLLDIREISMTDDTAFLTATATVENHSLTFQSTPIQERVRIRVVAAANSSVRLRKFVLEELPPEPLTPVEVVWDTQFAFGNGIFEPSDEKQISGVLKVNSKKAVKAVLSVLLPDGKILQREEKKLNSPDVPFAVSVPVINTENTLEVIAFDANENKLVTVRKPICHHPHRENQVTFRDDGMTLVDGKPFFMIAHWWFTRRGDKGGNVDWWYENDLDAADDMVFLKQAGFNTLLVRTPNQVKLAGERGLKAIIEYPHKLPSNPADNAKAREAYRLENLSLQKDPALLAYYGPDEPLVFVCPFEKIMESSAFVHELDPYHPIFYNESPTGTADVQHRYSDWCDTIGRDIYPVPGTPETRHGDLPEELKLAAVGVHTDICTASVYGRKPVWMILQAFAWLHIYGGHNLKPVEEITDWQVIYPTYEENRFMAYNAITHGATGLMYHYLGYTVHVPETFWIGLRNVLQELNFLSNVLTERTVEFPQLVCSSSAVRLMVKKHDEHNYYFIVNETDQPIQAVFAQCAERRLNTLFSSTPIDVKDGGFTLQLAPYDVRVMSDFAFPEKEAILHPETYVPYSQFPVLRGKSLEK